MTNPHLRIFPYSRDEFPSIDSLTTWLMTGLKARGGTYYLRSANSVRDLDPGSIVLFRYHDKIIGEGVVTNYIKGSAPDRTIPGEDFEYEARVVFAPSSIRLYAPAVPVDALQRCIGEEPNIVPSAQPYFKLTDWSVYPKLLAVVTRGGLLL